MYLPGVWPKLSLVHKTLGSISIILPYAFLYLSAHSDPGVVTPTTHSQYMAHYPYDFALFHPGQSCRTCGLLKPPRSKHCSVCKRCVHKMDHHCVFINNCVGYGNQHYFILLLLSTAVLTLYGGILGLCIIADAARVRNPAFALWPKPPSWPWHEYFILLTFGIQTDVGVGSVTLLALMTSPLVWGLLTYHIYLIWSGTTTNESMKWQDWQLEMDDGCAFRRQLPPDRQRDLRTEASWTRWPVNAAQILIRTEDGTPPSLNAGPGVGEWERVWQLRDIENLYDLGFWDNLVDVFVPNYAFGRPTAAAEESAANADLERGKRRRRIGGRKAPRAPRASSLVAAAT